MTEDEIKAWFFKYGQYANGKDMALIKAIEAAINPQCQWVGLTKKEFQEAVEGLEDLEDCWVAIETKLRSKNHG